MGIHLNLMRRCLRRGINRGNQHRGGEGYWGRVSNLGWDCRSNILVNLCRKPGWKDKLDKKREEILKEKEEKG